MTAAALLAALLLAGVHAGAGALRLFDRVPRSGWLSAFAGISVAYVFAHLLPEVARRQEALEGGPVALESEIHLVVLAGVVVFFAVEQHSQRSRRRRADDRTGPAGFWTSIASFGAYNVIVGYLLLHGEVEDAGSLALYTVALAVHFVVNDAGLRDHHKDAYDRRGRWLLAAAVIAGSALGALAAVPETAVALALAFLAGGIVLNVMKEELPRERCARIAPFATGALAYAALLQLV